MYPQFLEKVLSSLSLLNPSKGVDGVYRLPVEPNNSPSPLSELLIGVTGSADASSASFSTSGKSFLCLNAYYIAGLEGGNYRFHLEWSMDDGTSWFTDPIIKTDIVTPRAAIDVLIGNGLYYVEQAAESTVGEIVPYTTIYTSIKAPLARISITNVSVPEPIVGTFTAKFKYILL